MITSLFNGDLNEASFEFGGGDSLQVSSGFTADERNQMTVTVTDDESLLSVCVTEGYTGCQVVLEDILEGGSLSVSLDRGMLERLMVVFSAINEHIQGLEK